MPSMSAPSFYTNDEQIPELKHWEVGEKYRLVVDVIQKSKEEVEKSTSARFEIVGYKYMPHKSMDEMTDKEFAEYQDEMMSK